MTTNYLLPDDDEARSLREVAKMADEVARIERLTHHMFRVRERAEHLDAAMATVKEQVAQINERSARRDEKIGHLDQQLTAMRSEINEELSCLVRAMQEHSTRSAVADERMTQLMSVVQTCLTQHNGSEQRIRVLEIAQPTHERTGNWMDKLIWALAAAALSYMAYRTGLIK